MFETTNGEPHLKSNDKELHQTARAVFEYQKETTSGLIEIQGNSELNPKSTSEWIINLLSKAMHNLSEQPQDQKEKIHLELKEISHRVA